MKKVFRNSSQTEVIFTDEGITFYGEHQEVHYPYGCIDSIHFSLLGVLQVGSSVRICCFAVDRKDRTEMKSVLKYVKTAMASAPKAEAQVFDRCPDIPCDLPAEEQLKRYKALFIQGSISKEEYDIRKTQLKD